MTDAQGYLASNRPRLEAELMDLLRIPSVSALPEHARDVQRAAEWVAERLRSAGLEDVDVLVTEGHPVVCGHWLGAPGRPTVLIYGHFDVQPVDPLELWTSPPFEPTVRDGCVYARGASDMKAGLLGAIAGVEALLRTAGRLPVNVKFFVEGEEEIGSPAIPSFLAANAARFAADVVVSADSAQLGPEEPALYLGYRGLAGVQVDVRGARGDLHSGVYGGIAPNAAQALVELLGTLRDGSGRIAVAGFYDDVRAITPTDAAAIAAAPFDEAEVRGRLGLSTLVGERGYTPRERLTARPTLEINGIWGGFQGACVKTVIPNEAHAKITCRLVADQDPARVVDLLTAHLRAYAPASVQVTVAPLPGRARPYYSPPDYVGNRAAADVLAEVYGRAPTPLRSGATLPVTGIFLDHLGAYTVGLGFSLEDEQFHAPNEFTRLASFERCQLAYARLPDRLAQEQPAALRPS